jgi:hypothetical protein
LAVPLGRRAVSRARGRGPPAVARLSVDVDQRRMPDSHVVLGDYERRTGYVK